MAISTMIGAKIHRREDPRLVSGHGRYVDDLSLTNCAYLQVVRSPFAHARITHIDSEAARQAPGVLAVYTAQDFAEVISGAMPVAPAFVAEKKTVPDRRPIAGEETSFQGEPVAVVVAETRYQAADAAQLVSVDYEPLPAVMDLEAAIQEGSPKTHLDLPDNFAWDLTYADDTERAFSEAEVVVKQRILQQRLVPMAMEPRVVMAEWREADGNMTLWLSSQNPHFIRLFVGGAMGIPESRFRVISPDVGGGFGSKISPYPEDYLVPAAAKLLGQPVKWTETRTENIQATTHGRGQVFDVELAGLRDGTMLGMRVTQYLDCGAYVGTFGAFQACACLLPGQGYKFQQIASRTVGVLTNRVPTDPYRGAGRPEATHLCERMVDIFAAEIKRDPAEVRRKNFVQPDEFPYTNNFGLSYDSGNYEGTLNRALELAGYEKFRQEQEGARKEGRLLGIGISTWIEICGFGPSAATAPATGGLALTESSHVRVFPTGSVAVYTGTHSHGQGHETTFAQLVADTLGVPYDSIDIHHGDTAEGPAFGYGTYGSRSLAVGGMSIVKAAQKVREKARQIAAHMLEAADEDVIFDQGHFAVKGSPDKRKTFAEVAFAAYGMGLPEDMELGLEAVAYFDPPNFVWPFGAHICAVEVDPTTGSVELLKYVAVDDCGTVINPMIVEGQLHGGIAQGIAQALFEEVVYDSEGTLKTGTLLDYSLPTIAEMPKLTLDSTVTPSPTNELGVKGIGEAGTIASSAAVINALCDALSPLGLKHIDMPASPDRLWQQITERQGKGAGSGEGATQPPAPATSGQLSTGAAGGSTVAEPQRGGTSETALPGSESEGGGLWGTGGEVPPPHEAGPQLGNNQEGNR
ncbi:MAG: molybdopterin-dependent oxidoreductase [Candidatus Dormibacteraeota bacterium]|nr:molybdopterin-dependent oxidoreductase [Candidatus Dormibacteraeota bacterium]